MRIELDVVSPAIARGDSGAIRQILINVLDNAAKYGPIGQTITIGVRNEAKVVKLWVDDCGPEFRHRSGKCSGSPSSASVARWTTAPGRGARPRDRA